jgi:hypothetical protein
METIVEDTPTYQRQQQQQRQQQRRQRPIMTTTPQAMINSPTRRQHKSNDFDDDFDEDDDATTTTTNNNYDDDNNNDSNNDNSNNNNDEITIGGIKKSTKKSVRRLVEMDPPSSVFMTFLMVLTKYVIYVLIAFFCFKQMNKNIFYPLFELSNADYTLKTVVRDIFIGYERPLNHKSAASVREIENRKKLTADENHLKRKLEFREKQKRKFHEKLGLNHDDERERAEIKKMKKLMSEKQRQSSANNAHNEL